MPLRKKNFKGKPFILGEVNFIGSVGKNTKFGIGDRWSYQGRGVEYKMEKRKKMGRNILFPLKFRMLRRI